jgi:hypothetical protein
MMLTGRKAHNKEEKRDENMTRGTGNVVGIKGRREYGILRGGGVEDSKNRG